MVEIVEAYFGLVYQKNQVLAGRLRGRLEAEREIFEKGSIVIPVTCQGDYLVIEQGDSDLPSQQHHQLRLPLPHSLFNLRGTYAGLMPRL